MQHLGYLPVVMHPGQYRRHTQHSHRPMPQSYDSRSGLDPFQRSTAGVHSRKYASAGPKTRESGLAPWTGHSQRPRGHTMSLVALRSERDREIRPDDDLDLVMRYGQFSPDLDSEKLCVAPWATQEGRVQRGRQPDVVVLPNTRRDSPRQKEPRRLHMAPAAPSIPRLPSPELAATKFHEPDTVEYQFCACCDLDAEECDQAQWRRSRAKMDRQSESVFS
ncbi:hypothetical protein GGR56DRAFT_649942 [Xylariaceae sp. FL0804]|nr:hypothetical protein GGR56DRAFT_649942 [Xylariaceae sp. FL0804]